MRRIPGPASQPRNNILRTDNASRSFFRQRIAELFAFPTDNALRRLVAELTHWVVAMLLTRLSAEFKMSPSGDRQRPHYFYRPRLAGAYRCNLKVSWYLRRNRTPGTSDCTKRPDFDASCCFDRTCTHQRRLIWDSRIMVRRQDRPDDSNFSQDTPDRPEIVLSYAWSGRAFPGGRPT